MRWQRRLNIVLSIAISMAFLLLGAFVFRISYIRTIEALTDLYGGFKYYICELFELGECEPPSVIEFSKVLNWSIFLPEDFETFKANFIEFCKLFVTKENFLNWLSETGQKVGDISKIIVLILPCILALWMALKMLYNKPNTKHNVDTVPLRIYKTITGYTIEPLKRYVKQYVEFLKEHPKILVFWIVIWVFNLNFATIIIAFLGYYFYFAVSFDLASIYVQVVKMFIDLQVVVKFVSYLAYCNSRLVYFRPLEKESCPCKTA